MRYEVKFRFKGAKTWIRKGSYKTYWQAQDALNRMEETSSDCPFVEYAIGKEEAK